MKVAVATDGGDTISAHFGMARHYLVYDVEGGEVRSREAREKAGHAPGATEHHHHGAGPGTDATHSAMLSNIEDCEVVVARGMGAPMYEFIKSAGMKVFITTKSRADDAVRALAGGTLDNHPELLH